jgi:hypothetical protein
VIEDFRLNLTPSQPAPYSHDVVVSLCKRGEVAKAIRLLKQNGQAMEQWTEIIQLGLKKLFVSRRINELLSLVFKYGLACPYEIQDLLRDLFRHGDIPGFLKQAHRFAVCDGLESEIDAAIEWLRQHGQRDGASAYRDKFDALRQGAAPGTLSLTPREVKRPSPPARPRHQ